MNRNAGLVGGAAAEAAETGGRLRGAARVVGVREPAGRVDLPGLHQRVGHRVARTVAHHPGDRDRARRAHGHHNGPSGQGRPMAMNGPMVWDGVSGRVRRLGRSLWLGHGAPATRR